MDNASTVQKVIDEVEPIFLHRIFYSKKDVDALAVEFRNCLMKFRLRAERKIRESYVEGVVYGTRTAISELNKIIENKFDDLKKNDNVKARADDSSSENKDGRNIPVEDEKSDIIEK